MDTYEIENTKILKTHEDDCDITIENSIHAVIEPDDLGIPEDVFAQFSCKNINYHDCFSYL